MSTAGSTFDISEATTRKIQIVEAMLFVAEIHAEGLSVTYQAMQLKAGEITKSAKNKAIRS